MNITYFIGNGFDINIGLHTDYRSFLRWYLRKISDAPEDPVISKFAKLIQKDIETWSNLELTLGQKTLESPLDKPETFLKCKTHLDLHLREYLRKQNDAFPHPPYREYIPQFKNSLCDFLNFCEPQVQNELRNIYKQHIKEDHTINIIDFNFTDTVDLLWAKTPNKIKKVFPRRRIRKDDTILKHLKKELAAGNTYYNKGELIHIHGTLDNTMLTGVNDISQLSNKDIKNNEDILECCIKPLMNDHSGNHLNERVNRIIRHTDIFIVFGMSIGETDRVWWNAIAQQVISNPNSYLLLVNYNPNYNSVLTYTRRYASKGMEKSLLKVTQVDPGAGMVLKSRMSILFNTDLFKLNERKLHSYFRPAKE